MINSKLTYCLICTLLLLTFSGTGFALSDEEVLSLQNSLKDEFIGERIAHIAERFVGTPYDPDPLGAYVSRSVIVADEKVDCMYLVFRAVEIALSASPEEAVRTALDRRFKSKGIIRNGKVVNYDDRFAYGEDMISSGKWGKEITRTVGRTLLWRKSIEMLPPGEVLEGMKELKNGDLLFFIKAPSKAKSGEIVGHMGIISISDRAYLIHASGRKGKGGVVKKTVLSDYLKKMPFIGVKITRFP